MSLLVDRVGESWIPYMRAYASARPRAVDLRNINQYDILMVPAARLF